MINLVLIDSEISKQLLELAHADIGMIKEACKILGIKSIQNSKIFVKRANYSSVEEGLKDTLLRSFSITSYTIFYQDLNRNHPNYDYYSIVGFASNDLVDIKKIMKIHKLKAFI
jgi:hypothetical protein